jgi:hypothetical protein
MHEWITPPLFPMMMMMRPVLLLLLSVAPSRAASAPSSRTAETGGSRCANLVTDCGALPDDATDASAAFYRCMDLAAQRAGCVTVPPGAYRISPVELNVSNVEFRVDNRVVFRPHRTVGTTGSAGALFTFGQRKPTSPNYVTNVSLHGSAPGHFTSDVSTPLFKPWKIRAAAFGGIKGFLIANVLAKMSPADSRSELPDGDGRSQWCDFQTPTPVRALFPVRIPADGECALVSQPGILVRLFKVHGRRGRHTAESTRRRNLELILDRSIRRLWSSPAQERHGHELYKFVGRRRSDLAT